MRQALWTEPRVFGLMAHVSGCIGCSLRVLGFRAEGLGFGVYGFRFFGVWGVEVSHQDPHLFPEGGPEFGKTFLKLVRVRAGQLVTFWILNPKP